MALGSVKGQTRSIPVLTRILGSITGFPGTPGRNGLSRCIGERCLLGSLRSGGIRFSSATSSAQRKVLHAAFGSGPIGPNFLRWIDPPQNVLVVAKPNDERTLEAAASVIEHVRVAHPTLSVFVESVLGDKLGPCYGKVIGNGPNEFAYNSIDLVICLGGDGTVLHTSSLFSRGPVPPIVGFSLGSLGFLMPFPISRLESVLASILASEAHLLLRMRLECSILDADGSPCERFQGMSAQAMNEVYLHRGRHPHMTVIDAFVDGQRLTEAVADGLIVSTPTGSTAYSLSAGGPIIHPLVQTLVLTPICPRSLSFRTVLLPSEVTIALQISPNSRSPAELSLDGREVQLLESGEILKVKSSPFPVPCVSPSDSSSLHCDQSWVKDINAMLSFNRTFLKRGLPDGG